MYRQQMFFVLTLVWNIAIWIILQIEIGSTLQQNFVQALQ